MTHPAFGGVVHLRVGGVFGARIPGGPHLPVAPGLRRRDGIPESGNIVAGNLNVAKGLIDAIGQQATPALLKV